MAKPCFQSEKPFCQGDKALFPVGKTILQGCKALFPIGKTILQECKALFGVPKTILQYTKNKPPYPTDDTIIKLGYSALREVSKKNERSLLLVWTLF